MTCFKDLEFKAKWVRKTVFETIINAGKGHLGGSLSCVEILVSLYQGGFLNLISYNNRDRFILSKGHACCTLYTILADMGYFSIEELNDFAKEGSKLEAHVTNQVPGVEIMTGSLGNGLGLGTGLALAFKMDNKPSRVVVLMGDGECQEGSVWEAAMFASHHKLDNLIVIIDRNHLSVLDTIENYNALASIRAKFEAFGWDCWHLNGHNFNDIFKAFGILESKRNAPVCLIAETIKGKGISFMENTPKWHHSIPNKEEIEIARKELRNG